MKKISGRKFNRLTALDVVGKNRYGYIWKCKCDCGNETNVTASDLIRGNTKSCGCYRKNRLMLPRSEYNFRHVLRVYKNSADRRKLDFQITSDEVRELTSGNCYYCGQPPSQIMRRNRSNGDYIYNGIDRLDNTKGYVKGNCVSCCFICNSAKRVMSEIGFLTWVKKVYEFRNLSESTVSKE